jgi:light-regulated signal transduction histidine kinase (bacteriophytochrome)
MYQISLNNMEDYFKVFHDQLHASALTPDAKQTLLHSLKKVEKDYARMDFLHRRILKDKSITINILKETVVELQTQKDYAVTVNEQLVQQKQLLEDQSKKLTKNLNALQMSYSELELFAYIASHDLKSPLRNIGSYAQLLKRRYKGKLDADADEFIDYIVNNAQTMNNIIGDLLVYSRVDRDKDLAKANFSRLVELVKHNIRDTILENNVEIECGELPTLWVHRSSIIQLFQNLLENAIKFRAAEPPRIRIDAQQRESDGSWQISVTDNGVGLDEEYQEKAFLPFQRINHRDRPGSGMGLAICRKVVRLHGGDIWYKKNHADKVDEGGTSFHFTIAQQEHV